MGSKGQTTVEYILMLAVITAMFMAVQRGLRDSGAIGALGGIASRDFKQTYQFGHPKAKGADQGGPEKQIRVPEGDNFRLFVNPKAH
jgi:hypothetical protein